MLNKFAFYSRSMSLVYTTCLLVIVVLFTQCKSSSQVAGSGTGKIRTLIVGGGSSHDFDRWYKQEDVQTLTQDGLADVTYTSNIDSILYFLPDIDVLCLTNNQPIKDLKVREAIFNFANAGKGVVLAHAALWYNWRDWPEYNLQLVSGGSRGHDRYGSFEVTVVDPNHPVMKGVDNNFTLKDELYYYKVDSTGLGIKLLAVGAMAGSDKKHPSVFVVNHPKARIVGIALGHDAESHTITPYKTLLRNAVRWAAGK